MSSRYLIGVEKIVWLLCQKLQTFSHFLEILDLINPIKFLTKDITTTLV